MRPKIPDSDKRKDKLIIRVSMEEKLRIRTLTKSGKYACMSDFIRVRIFNQTKKKTIALDDETNMQLKQMDYELNKIGVNLNQLSKRINSFAGYNIGDKVTIDNGGTPVESVGLADKNGTGQAMTFTIVAKPTATSISVYPKPIAVDDGALTATEAAYANINTVILNGATVERVNSDVSNKTNLFWDKDAVEVLGGTIPAQLFKEFDGMKVISHTMKNGQEMYMVYDGNIATMNFRYRLFTWYGITIKDPSRVGVSVTF
jgi:hypothetical protein